MKVQFLGTAASPSIPIPFCHCQICTVANRVRGKNLRKRSSALVNQDMLIDIGPDLSSSSSEHNIPLNDISICLQTHFHEDHFDPEMIFSRHADYGTVLEKDLLLAGSIQTLKMMDSIIGRRYGCGSIFEDNLQTVLKIKLLPVTPLECYAIGDYLITGYPANHGRAQDGCLIYAVEYKNKCLFYATDTSIIFEEVWEHLGKTGKRFDLIVLDHTYGFAHESKPADHLAIKDFLEHVQRFKSSGLLSDEGLIYATHISHEGIIEHSELDRYAEANNYRIAYDGLVISF